MATAYYSIDHAKIDAGLSNFPVGIKIESSTGFMSGLVATDWQYLHATVGGSECYVEVDVWDTTNDKAVLWVKVPSVLASANTVIKVEKTAVLNTSVYVGETGDTAAQNVWDSSFKAVFHMSQDPTGAGACILDSTSNGNDGTPGGSMTSGDLVSGGFGKALDFDGVDDVINVAAIGALTQWTISGYFDSDTVADQKILITNDLSGWNDDVLIGINPESGTGNKKFAVTHQDATNSIRTSLAGASILSISRYNSFSTVSDGSTLKFLFNDETISSKAKEGAALTFGNNAVQIGYSTNGDRKWFGKIDEIFISNVARTDAWIKATDNVLNDSLLTYSATDPAEPTETTKASTAGIGLSDTTDGHITIKQVSASVNLGLGDTFVHNFGISSADIGFSVAPGHTLDRKIGAVSGIRFNEVAGGTSADLKTTGAFTDIGFSGLPGHTVEMSAPAGSGLRLGEVSGAFLANVIATGASAGLGFGETAGGVSATVKTAGAVSTIGFDAEATRINEVSEVEVLAGLGLGGTAGKNVEMQPGVLSGLGLGALVGAIRDINPGLVEGLDFGVTAGALNYSAWVRANKAAAVYRYYATITGAADGLADYVLSGPKSIQIRARNNEPSYLSVSIPYSASDIAAIQARQNGELVVDMVASIGGVEALREELLRTDFHSVRYDQGPRNRSITVIGYRTQTFGAGTVALDNVVTESMLADGTLHYRCAKPDFFLKPGHTVTYGANEFTAAMVSCIINPTYQSMEVQE